MCHDFLLHVNVKGNFNFNFGKPLENIFTRRRHRRDLVVINHHVIINSGIKLAIYLEQIDTFIFINELC